MPNYAQIQPRLYAKLTKATESQGRPRRVKQDYAKESKTAQSQPRQCTVKQDNAESSKTTQPKYDVKNELK